jgi:hypothetical protein
MMKHTGHWLEPGFGLSCSGSAGVGPDDINLGTRFDTLGSGSLLTLVELCGPMHPLVFRTDVSVCDNVLRSF